MKTAKQAQRDAKILFRLCVADGSLDEDRARRVVRELVDAGRAGALPVLSRFQRLLRLDRRKHSADVISAVPLPADVRATLEADIARRYGPGIVTAFGEDQTLIGGVRITVGSDVYDGTVRGALAALETHF
jgi:F-type H+-transporting ATPase subunit delta